MGFLSSWLIISLHSWIMVSVRLTISIKNGIEIIGEEYKKYISRVREMNTSPREHLAEIEKIEEIKN